MRRYRLTYTYRNWAREPASPFATATVVFDDPSAAHEYGLKLKQQGHVNIRIEPFTDTKVGFVPPLTTALVSRRSEHDG